MADILIKGGFVIDGTGRDGYLSDIAISNGKITAIGENLDENATTIIDANGKTVCPGFIDPHVHEELPILGKDDFESYLRQGVTTTVNGNCGHSVTPGNSDDVYEYMFQNGLLSGLAREKYRSENPVWEGLSGFAKVAQNNNPSINMALLLGHGTIRWYAMGGSKDRAPTTEEISKMKQYIREGMEQGAVGLSTGLDYIPGIYSKTDELIELAKVVAEYSGVYASHLRAKSGCIESVSEAIEIGKASGARVQVSHLTPNCKEGFELIDAAYKDGMEICVDTIPKSSGHLKRKDRLIQFIMSASDSLFGKTLDDFAQALKTPEGRADIAKSTRFKDVISVVNTGDESIEGKMLIEIAKERNSTIDDVLCDLLLHGRDELTFWQGGINRADFMGVRYSDAIANMDVVSPGSDRIFGEVFDRASWYELFRKGAFPIYYDCMRQAGIKTEELVRRMTSLVARQFRFNDRGVLKNGYAADIVIIDFEKFSYPKNDEIDYTDANVMASGVDTVIVNGVVTLQDGTVTGNRGGKLISSHEKTII